MTLDEFSAALEEIAGSLPQKLFENLNGGVNIREEALLSPDSVPEEPRYILGQYHHYRVLGRWIDLYYGSFCRAFPQETAESWRQEIEKVLRHELRHHIEEQAGETTLRDEDLKDARAYRLRHLSKGEEKQ